MPGLSGPSQRGKGWTSGAKPKKKKMRRRPSCSHARAKLQQPLAAVALGIDSGKEREDGILAQLEEVTDKVSDAAEAAVDKLKELFVGED